MLRRIALLGFLVALFLPVSSFARRQEAVSPIPPAPDHVTPPPLTSPKVSRIKVGGKVQASLLIHQVSPKYPDEARAAQVEGSVLLHAIIAKDGTIKELTVISGPPLLVDAASGAVKQWVYKPMLLNGDPVEVDTTISVVFTLADPSQSPDAVDPKLKADIHHLLLTMKGQEAAEAGVRATFDSLRPQLEASLPHTANRDKVIDAYEEKLVGLVREPDFQEGIVAIYAKHFTDEEVKAIDQFFQTPAGQRFIEETPVVVNESATLGQQAATASIPRILNELCREFPELQGESDFCPPDTIHKQSLLLPPAAQLPMLNAKENYPAGN